MTEIFLFSEVKLQHKCVLCDGCFPNLTRHIRDTEGIPYAEIQKYVPYKMRPRKGTLDEAGRPQWRPKSHSPDKTPKKLDQTPKKAPETIPVRKTPASVVTPPMVTRGRGRRGGSADRTDPVNEEEVDAVVINNDEVPKGDAGETSLDKVDDDKVKTGNLLLF